MKELVRESLKRVIIAGAVCVAIFLVLDPAIRAAFGVYLFAVLATVLLLPPWLDANVLAAWKKVALTAGLGVLGAAAVFSVYGAGRELLVYLVMLGITVAARMLFAAAKGRQT